MFFKKGLIRQQCQKVCKNPFLCDDLEQEVTMIMMDKEPELIEQLNAKGEFLFYVLRVVKNQFNSRTSSFFKKYKQFNQITDENDRTQI